LGDDVGGHAPAALDVDALFPGPVADCGRIDGAAGTAATQGSPGDAVDLAGVVDIFPQRCVKLAGVLSVRVDLIVDTSRPNRTLPAPSLPSMSSM
jgi:hypothetical protein